MDTKTKLNNSSMRSDLFLQFKAGVPREQVARLSEQTRTNAAVTLILVAIILIFVQSQHPLPWLNAWALLHATLVLLMLYRFRRSSPAKRDIPNSETKTSKRGLRAAVLYAGISGGLWGSLALFLPDLPMHLQVLLMLAIGGVSAGATATLSAVIQVSITFILCACLPLITYQLMLATPVSYALALIFTVNTGAMISTSFIVFRTVTSLRHSEERYRNLLNGIPDPITMHKDNRLIFMNQAALQLFGYDWEAAQQMMVKDFIIPDDHHIMDRRRSLMLAGESPPAEELRCIKSDGSIITIEAHGYLTMFANEKTQLAIYRDVTERKKNDDQMEEYRHKLERRYENQSIELKDSETQLRQAQRMEAVGQLAGGIAHDFNNILTVILGYSELILEKMDKSDPWLSQIEQINYSGERASLLTSQLLAFSRKQILQPKVMSITSVFLNIQEMLHRIIGEHINLEFHSPPEVSNVCADPGQIEQVIMNLVINAQDALAHGGSINVGVSNVILQDQAASAFDLAAGEYVMLTVSDNGKGMDKETQNHIFEPFFTTKIQGEGTGLGLSTVFGIVKQSDGGIMVRSRPGKGTEFSVCFPVEPLAIDLVAEKPFGASRNGNETIMIVEDDRVIGELLDTALTELGYSVIVKDDCDDALAFLDSCADPIDLLITDIVMPKMNGLELAARVVKARPNISVLYVSGYDQQLIAENLHGRFLQKPLGIKDLSEKIREILDDEKKSNDPTSFISKH